MIGGDIVTTDPTATFRYSATMHDGHTPPFRRDQASARFPSFVVLGACPVFSIGPLVVTYTTIHVFKHHHRFVMVLLSLAQFGEAPVFVNPRRRGGINYAADSAEAMWAAEAAAQPCREDTRGRISVDQEAGAFEMRPRGKASRRTAV